MSSCLEAQLGDSRSSDLAGDHHHQQQQSVPAVEQPASTCGQAPAACSTVGRTRPSSRHDERRLRIELAAAEEQVLALIDAALCRTEAMERSDPVANVQAFLDKRKQAVPAPPPNSSRAALNARAAPHD